MQVLLSATQTGVGITSAATAEINNISTVLTAVYTAPYGWL